MPQTAIYSTKIRKNMCTCFGMGDECKVPQTEKVKEMMEKEKIWSEHNIDPGQVTLTRF